MRSLRFVTAIVGAAVVGAAALPLAFAAATTGPAVGHGAQAAEHVAGQQTRRTLGPDEVRFSHETVVDEQRSGFEPNILIDSHDHMYTSVPNGSSQGTSFVWSSRDHGKSFQLVPGSVLQGKPETCSGGGDTELQLDKADNLFLSDLQNLTNLSNSVTSNGGRTWKTTCVGAVNTPVDRMWYAVKSSLGKPDFAIYEEYDAVASGADPGSPAGNQLVEEVSSDGVNFVPVVNPDFTQKCLGGGAYNCVTNDEGISGNQLIMPSGEVVIAHSSSDGNGVVVSYGTPKLTRVGGTIVSATAKWHNVTVNKPLCPNKSGAAPGICGSSQFATVAQDTAGNLYVSFSSAELAKNGDQVGPYNVYVVSSKDNGKTWSQPARVSGGGSNSFSWVTAGSKGRVAMAWYHANQSRGKGGYTFDDLTDAEFSVQESMSINALAARPTYRVSTVSEHPIKYGPICTQGLNCTISGGDRSLGDFLEVSHDRRGALSLSYVNDTSNTYTTGATGFAENGPPVVVRQIHGPSLIKGATNTSGYINGPGRGPGAPMDTIRDAEHDAIYSANSARTPAGANLDLRAASIQLSKDGKSLVCLMTVSSLKSLAVESTSGGTTGEWILRFTTYNPHTLGNGHIYYAGMESVAGAAPTFFDGDTSAPTNGVQLSMNFSSAHHVPGSISVEHGRIRIEAPLKDFPGITARQPKLYSATAFTGTTALTLAVPNPTGIQGQINQIDATAPFDVVVPLERHAIRPVTPSLSTATRVAASIGGGLVGGAAVLVIGVGIGTTRRSRRRLPERQLIST